MSYFIVVREYKPTDFHNVFEVVRNAYLSNVFTTWCNALTREITFQLIVMAAAILFIFLGVPLQYCVISIPVVVIMIYVLIYSSYLIKSAELMHSKKPIQCWVAERVSHLCLWRNQKMCLTKFLLMPKYVMKRLIWEIIEGRQIIGTVAVSNHMILEKSLWLHRLAVDKSYRNKRIGHALLQTAQNWCRRQNYGTLEAAMSECQDSARKLFMDTGFEIRQLYHQQLIGSAVTLLMYQMSCDLNKFNQNFDVFL